jgi:tRNA modification GTPase
VEAAIDFPDEGIDAEGVVRPALAMAKELEAEVCDLLADSGRGERLREGLTVTIAGPVNVGKSSILNRLAKRSAAIVSPHAGTTRDIVEVHLDLFGFPVTVIDTAGLRDTADPVEEEGVRRARARAKGSDLVLWVMDATLPCPIAPPSDLFQSSSPPVWVLVNKTDLVPEEVASDVSMDRYPWPRDGAKVYRISAQTGASFDDLVRGVSHYAREFFSGGAESPLVTRERHRSALSECADALRRTGIEGGGLGREDIIAEELRLAARALGRLVGKVDVENVLDVIFRDFCIGK